MLIVRRIAVWKEIEPMATVFQITGSILIIAAAAFYIKKNDRAKMGATKWQMILAVWQIIFCGWFFALCISDVLDFSVSFSYIRFTLNIFYAIAFLSLSVYVLFAKHRNNDRDLKGVLIAVITLIVVQCFVFPYGTESEFWRIFEAVEGALVFGLLVAVFLRVYDEGFCRKCLLIATVFEFIVAVENVAMPFSSIINDPQLIDIALNYSSLFMRPVLMASLSLTYRVWQDRRK